MCVWGQQYLGKEMYWPEISVIKYFYETELGMAVCRHLRQRIKNICGEPGSRNSVSIIGIGYTTPYLAPYLNGIIPPIAIMPAAQGAMKWPGHEKNLSLLTKEYLLPFADCSAERVVVAHALEYTEQQAELLREVSRVLTPGGKAVIVVPNRLSIWARVEKTPFGHGHPFTKSQLEALLDETDLRITEIKTALFFPPTQQKFILSGADYMNFVGSKLLAPLGGVLVAEVEKQIFNPVAVKKDRKSSMIHQPAIEVLRNNSLR